MNSSLSNNLIMRNISKPYNLHHQNFKFTPQQKPTKDEILYKSYYLIPPRQGRYIVLDTETTGFEITSDRLISINAVEMIKGELTGMQFNAYLDKRFYESKIQNKNGK